MIFFFFLLSTGCQSGIINSSFCSGSCRRGIIGEEVHVSAEEIINQRWHVLVEAANLQHVEIMFVPNNRVVTEAYECQPGQDILK